MPCYVQAKTGLRRANYALSTASAAMPGQTCGRDYNPPLRDLEPVPPQNKPAFQGLGQRQALPKGTRNWKKQGCFVRLEARIATDLWFWKHSSPWATLRIWQLPMRVQ